MSSEPRGEALWQYSLHLYAQPAVSSACLRLQDESGADVNMILLLLFAATEGAQLSAQEVAALDQECSGWRETVIEPLRRIRRLIKTDELRAHCDVYGQVKAAELLAERRHLLALAVKLERIFAEAQKRSPYEAAMLNLQAYAPLRNAPADTLDALLNAFARGLPRS